MTEDEAKTNWCPFARYKVNRWPAANGDTSVVNRCLASACMAWRWDKREGDIVTVAVGTAAIILKASPAVYEPIGDPMAGHQSIVRLIGEGRCGLVGEPK